MAGPGLGPPDPLEDAEIAAAVRRIRSEERRERQEIERAADLAHARGTGLAAVAVHAMMSGEQWRLHLPGARTLVGHVVHPGYDFVGIGHDANVTDVRLEAIELIETLEERVAGRAPVTFRPAAFAGRLLGVEGSGELVELAGMRDGWSLQGYVDTVRLDHLSFVVGTEPARRAPTLVRLDEIASLTRRRKDRRTRG